MSFLKWSRNVIGNTSTKVDIFLMNLDDEFTYGFYSSRIDIPGGFVRYRKTTDGIDYKLYNDKGKHITSSSTSLSENQGSLDDVLKKIAVEASTMAIVYPYLSVP